MGKNDKSVRNRRSKYDLQYPRSSYDPESFTADEIIVEGVAAWNSGKKDCDQAFISFAEDTLDEWKALVPFAAGNIRDGSCPEGSGSAVFDRLEQHAASGRVMERLSSFYDNGG